MNSKRFLLLALTALAVLCSALFLAAQRNRSGAMLEAALLPALAGEMNTVSGVEIRKAAPNPVLTIHKTGDDWTIAERADYPADRTKLRKLLTSLRDAHIVEQKTADPALYASIGVEDATKPGATGTEITVITAAAKPAVIIGKAVGEGSFVRRSGEQRSYAVEPSIAVESEPRFWIEARLLDVPSASIKDIDVKLDNAAPYSLHRASEPPAKPASEPKADVPPAAKLGNTFELTGVPAGRKPLDAPMLAPSPSLLTSLDAEDVSQADTIDFSHPAMVTVALTDGDVLTFLGAVAADKHWIQVKSSKQTALTTKASGRAFEIASYRYDSIFKPVDQLLVSKDAPPVKGGAKAGTAQGPKAGMTKIPKPSPTGAQSATTPPPQ